MKSVVCLSGGMDSATMLWRAATENGELHVISFDYNQRHKIELEYAKKLCGRVRKVVEHKIINIDMSQIGGSPLTDKSIDVPKASDKQQIKTVQPFRNTLFTVLAAAYAEVNSIDTIYLSPVQEDYLAYRDCRKEFFTALEHTLSLGSTYPIDFHIKTPYIFKTKKEVLEDGLRMGVPYELTYTCYEGDPQGFCGECDACKERIDAFKQISQKDPAKYLREIEWEDQ
jgi:7-cyano-7-deazaguanine synthase